MISRIRAWLDTRSRNIFHYWDGERHRSIDPAIAWRKMWEHPECDPQKDFGPATGYNCDFEAAAQDRVLKMARDMFGVKAYSEDGQGLTIDETFSLLWSFLGYMDGIKKKRESLPTVSPSTESSSLEEDSTTRLASALSSTGQESRSGNPSSSSKPSFQL